MASVFVAVLEMAYRAPRVAHRERLGGLVAGRHARVGDRAVVGLVEMTTVPVEKVLASTAAESLKMAPVSSVGRLPGL